MNEDN